MYRCRFGLVLAGGLSLLSVGCTMCAQPPEDYAYGAYGGLVHRADRLHGRVGSAFHPAEGVPPHGVEVPAAPYEGPVLLEPEYAPEELMEVPAQPAAAAFDPGDILSEPN